VSAQLTGSSRVRERHSRSEMNGLAASCNSHFAVIWLATVALRMASSGLSGVITNHQRIGKD
jgi:hypothetical protein